MAKTNIIERLRELGLETKQVAETKGGEYHGPCPFCGGIDRFSIRPNDPQSKKGFFFCRQCKAHGNLNSLVKKLSGDSENFHWSNPDYEKITTTRPRTFISQVKKAPSDAWQNALKTEVVKTSLIKPIEDLMWMRGISLATVKECGIKYFPEKTFCTVEGFEKKICIPQGIAIPNFRGEDLYSVHVRQLDQSPKYIYVKGSEAVPYHLTKLTQLSAPVIVVESELDAIMLYQEAGDLVHAVALASVSARPDIYIDSLLKSATHLFICLDYDKPGREEWKWWQQNYANAIQIFPPTGQDIGEFVLGHRKNPIREWVTSLLEHAENKVKIISRPVPEFKVYTLNTPDQVIRQIESLMNYNMPVAVVVKNKVQSVECTDIGLWQPMLMTLATSGNVFTIDLNQIPVSALQGLRECKLVTWDGLRQFCILKAMGLDIRAIECTKLQIDIKFVKNWDFEEHCQIQLGYGSADQNPNFNLDLYSPAEVKAAIIEAHSICEIFKIQSTGLNSNPVYERMAGTIPAIAQIQLNGLPFDWDRHEHLTASWIDEFERMEETDPEKNRLKYLINRWGQPLTRFRSPRTNRIHPCFVFNGAVTGRFTSQNPNVQGIPKNADLRALFRAPTGRMLVGADYSQLDLRVVAMLSKDSKMIEDFRSGTDIHRMTAARFYSCSLENVSIDQRNNAKKLNYAVLYGGGNPILIQRLEVVYPVLFRWRNQIQNENKNRAFIKTPSGRLILKNFSKDTWANQVVNYPVQSTSADVLFAALARLPKYLDGLDALIINCIHDEILLEVAQEDAESAKTALEKAMTDGFLDIFPDAPTLRLVEAKIAKNWAEIK